MTKCDFTGCTNQATYRTEQLIGPKNPLNQCDCCAPEWVKNKNTKSFAEKKFGRKLHTITRIL